MWNPRLGGKFEERLVKVVNQMDLTPCSGCDECSLRCATGVQMTYEEYEAVLRFVNESPDRDSIAEVTKQNKSVDLGDDVSVNMCRYKDMRGGCVVYPERPLICRLLGHVEWLPCPIEKIPLAVKTNDAVALMQEYSLHDRHTFEEWDALGGQDRGLCQHDRENQ